MVDQFVSCCERAEEPFQLNFAKCIILNRLDVSLLIGIGRSGRDGFAVRVEEQRICRDGRAYVAGVVDLFAVGDSTGGIEAAFSGEVGAALELVAAVCVCRSGVVVFGVWGVAVSVLMVTSVMVCDIPSGRRFKANFMARIVSAIWICCAAMAAEWSWPILSVAKRLLRGIWVVAA
jgi:hypothetical protein